MEIDPLSLTLVEMLRMDPLALHNLAKKSTGSLTRFRALLGRLLLAIASTHAYLEHGCSSAIHYAVLQLGLPRKEACALARVARALEKLPYLRMLANDGRIEWSKLREVVRVATTESQRDWAEACSTHTYAEIERLVARSQNGGVPLDGPGRPAPGSELRCHFEPDQMAVIERGFQLLCQQAGRAMSMAEAIEWLFAEKLAEGTLDEELLEDVKAEATKDLGWTDVVNADTEGCPANANVTILNPKSRVPTKVQRGQILRRDGYCCAVPGCENSIWLDVHHVIFYAHGGLTAPENLITLCTKCHKNVHDKKLRIVGRAPHGLRFLNQFGKDLRQERTLEVAYWLDIWCGWRGKETDRRYYQARAA